jgi:hypothetical protein
LRFSHGGHVGTIRVGHAVLRLLCHDLQRVGVGVVWCGVLTMLFGDSR